MKDVKGYEERLYSLLENRHKDWLQRIERGLFEEAEIADLKAILNEMKG